MYMLDQIREKAALRYICKISNDKLLFEDLLWIVNRVNFILSEKTNSYPISSWMIESLFYNDEKYMLHSWFEIEKEHLSILDIEVIEKVYFRWKVFGKWYIKFIRFINNLKFK